MFLIFLKNTFYYYLPCFKNFLFYYLYLLFFFLLWFILFYITFCTFTDDGDIILHAASDKLNDAEKSNVSDASSVSKACCNIMVLGMLYIY